MAHPWRRLRTAGVRSKSGKLFLGFCWRGVRCREFPPPPRLRRAVTGLADTRENRKKAEAFLHVIKGQIALGTFDYRAHFPNGTRQDRNVSGKTVADVSPVTRAACSRRRDRSRTSDSIQSRWRAGRR
jgi:integrase